MKRATQNMLYHLLPVVFWLLAAGGTLTPVVLNLSTYHYPLSANYYWGFMVAAIVLACIFIIRRIQRHTSSVTECFVVSLLLGIASYWLPTVVFLILPIWGDLIYRNLFDARAFSASFIGFCLVAVWAAVFIFMGWIANPWAQFFATENARGWIPTGAIVLAWLASTIVRQTLRVR